MVLVSDFYRGTLRVMDPNGFLLDIGSSELLIDDHERRTWAGKLTVSKGSCIDRKSLTALVETANGIRALAQISPAADADRGRFIRMRVKGLGQAPF